MPQYEAEVIETRAFLRRYRAEADNRDQAIAKLERGDTLEEAEVKDYGVLQREVQLETVMKIEVAKHHILQATEKSA